MAVAARGRCGHAGAGTPPRYARTERFRARDSMLLLHIDASPRESSDSRGHADVFIREWTRKNRFGIVAHRPVGRDPPPHVTLETRDEALSSAYAEILRVT